MAKTTSATASGTGLDAYMEAAREEARRRWGYPDMVDENPEVFEKAFGDGEDIAKLVRDFGEELELTDPGPWHPGRR